MSVIVATTLERVIAALEDAECQPRRCYDGWRARAYPPSYVRPNGENRERTRQNTSHAANSALPVPFAGRENGAANWAADRERGSDAKPSPEASA